MADSFSNLPHASPCVAVLEIGDGPVGGDYDGACDAAVGCDEELVKRLSVIEDNGGLNFFCGYNLGEGVAVLRKIFTDDEHGEVGIM